MRETNQEMSRWPEWLKIREAAEYLGISYGRMSTQVKEGVYPVSLVPGFKREIRISRSKLDEMMLATEIPARSATRDETNSDGGSTTS